jgi:hypothetical protein
MEFIYSNDWKFRAGRVKGKVFRGVPSEMVHLGVKSLSFIGKHLQGPHLKTFA